MTTFLQQGVYFLNFSNLNHLLVCVFFQPGSIKEKMNIKIFMEGSVNYHAFKCTAEGEGNPYEYVNFLSS